MNKITRRAVIALSALGVIAASQPVNLVQATETIKMIAIDGYPARAMWVKEFSGFFIPRVNEELAISANYKIEWQEAYGGTIVKPRGVLEGIRLGLGDIGIVTTVFHNSKLPSQGISGVTPFASTDARVVAKAVDEIAREFPQMNKELSAEDQVYLATGVVLDTYQIFSKKPVKTLADMTGMKIAGAGYNLRYLEGLENVAGVRGGLPNFYNMIDTGLVDAAMLWPEAAHTFKISEVAPYMIKADLGAVNTKTVTINSSVWKKLPDEVKSVLQKVAIEYRDHIAEIAMNTASESIKAYEASGGTVVEISTEDRIKWANELDKSGAPGSLMLKAYMEKLKAAGQKPLRDWASDL